MTQHTDDRQNQNNQQDEQQDEQNKPPTHWKGAPIASNASARRLTEDEAQRIQPGDVVFFPERRRHMVVGAVRATGIAAPLFTLEDIGRRDNHDGTPQASWQILCAPLPGFPTRVPYRGGYRYSVRTLRERGEPAHPIPGDPDRPDEAYLDGARLRARRDRLRMTQSELARLLGVESNTLARWERGDLAIGNPVMLDLALREVERTQPRRILARLFGAVQVAGKRYSTLLPPHVQPWYLYTLDGGHSLAIIPSGLMTGHADGADGQASDPADLLVPAPVRAVLRAAWRRRPDGLIEADLPYDETLGLVTDPADDEF